MQSYSPRFTLPAMLFGMMAAGLLLGSCVGQQSGNERAHVTDTTAHTNHLIHEHSPYLLQHAHNPVDWYPWGEEAFRKARREGKPIFLSVGYSTCHWCHVMERESFENEKIATILNDNFVSIKVDREERPDVDQVYMTFVQATTGSGGWPMNVWLTPDLKPFFGGTYFPPEDAGGRPGLRTLLLKIAETWKSDKASIVASGDEILQQLRDDAVPSKSTAVDSGRTLLANGFERIASSYDPAFGGFGGAPKFPRPVVYNFLLRYYYRTGDRRALDMTTHTLRAMADGGIHDHIGGGFHRYSTDARWHLPHFEKMLYDQAQLAISYLETYQITGKPEFAATARDILDYVLRDMTGPEGEFLSAEDADSPLSGNTSQHAEGAWYVWEAHEIEALLGEQDATIFEYYYGIEERGNVTADPRNEFPNKNVLTVSHTVTETAAHLGIPSATVAASIALSRRTLLAVRSKRPRPHLDDKTLTAWNGLMISAFARAYQVLDDERYLQAGIRAERFIEQHLYNAETGTLLRRYRGGTSAIPAYVDDYAFLIQALLDLYETSFDIDYLTRAIDLQNKQNAIFMDGGDGGYFSTSGNDPNILLRMKEGYDGAEPSPNSVTVLNLLRLAQMTDNHQFQNDAEATIAAFGQELHEAPETMPQMLVALDYELEKPKQIVVAGTRDAPDTRKMLRAIRHRFIPDKILLLADGGSGQDQLARYLDFINGVTTLDGNATAYICRDHVCKLPVTDIPTMITLLMQKSAAPLSGKPASTVHSTMERR